MFGLIEGLPDAVALRCVAFIPFYLHPKLELVSRSWKAAIRSAELFRARQEVGSLEDLLCVCCYDVDNKWQLYDPLRDLWITLPRLPSTIRHYFGVVSISQKLFVIGGCSFSADPVTGHFDEDLSCNEVWSHDPITQNWSMRAPMLESCGMFACSVLDGKIIVAGGMNSKYKITSTVEMYDPEKDIWFPLPDLLHPCGACCIGVVSGGKLHFVYKGMPVVQTFDSLECRWRVEEYGWFTSPSSLAAVQDSLFSLSQGFIFKQDGPHYQLLISAPQFLGRVGTGIIYFRGELYVIGGMYRHEHEYINLSDMHVLTLSGENPTWFSAAPVSRGCGAVLGCAELRV